jgi:RNA polymerase-binding transcription factor DksA
MFDVGQLTCQQIPSILWFRPNGFLQLWEEIVRDNSRNAQATARACRCSPKWPVQDPWHPSCAVDSRQAVNLAQSGVTMNGIGTVTHRDRLRRRRHDVDTTLRYLERERRQVIANTSLMDPKAFESRLRLLDHLSRSYQKEIAAIDSVMGGLQQTSGHCAGCQEPIEADRLESQPDADLCWNCFECSETLRG